MKKCIILKDRYLSKSRFIQYENMNEYILNLQSCKNYYIPLSLIEISFRNSLNLFFIQRVGENWLFNNQFIKPQLRDKIEISKKILYQQKKKVTHENILAELSFGFFVTFLKKPYQEYFRYKDILKIFPNITSNDKVINRHFVYAKINNIRLFRNKVFHHNKIINKIEFKNIQDNIDEILSYFDDEICIFAKRVNNE